MAMVLRGVCGVAILALGLVAVAGDARAQLGVASALADPPKLFSIKGPEPDISGLPAIRTLTNAGIKLYYLGERSKVHGWMIQKDNQVQMLYVTEDLQTVIMGAMMSANAENVTGEQIKYLATTNPDVGAMISAQGKQASGLPAAASPGGIVPSPYAGAPAPQPQPQPTAPLSPGEKLMADFKAARSVSMGAAQAPELYMVAVPSCPNCKSTWKELRDAVKGGKIQVRLIPTYNSAGDREVKQAAQLLKAANPLELWDRFVMGEAEALAGEPDEASMRAVTANLDLVSKWNIQGYPYLAYRGVDGRVKIVQGKPERMAAVLQDLGR